MKRRMLEHLRDIETISRKNIVKILGKNASRDLEELWCTVHKVCNPGKG